MSGSARSPRKTVYTLSVLMVAGAALSLVAAHATESAAQVENEVAVRSLLDQVGAAWNAGDGDSTATPFAEDGELISADGTRVNGRVEIAKYMSKLVNGSMKGSRLLTAGTQVRFLAPQVAALHSQASFLMSGATQPERHAVVSIIAVRGSRKWRVALLQSTRAPAPTAKPTATTRE